MTTPPPQHSEPPANLRAWLDAGSAAALNRSVAQLTLDGVRCVVKLRRPGAGRGISYVLRYLRAGALAVLCRPFVGEFPRPGVLLRNGLPYEAERLRHLRQANCRVPDVWWQQPGMLVLEHVGDNLPWRLRESDPATRRELVRAVALDLAAFHARGLWHGGAQLRNLTLRNGEIWRIDFEENIGGALSLPLAQAYDVFQTLSSLQSMRRVPEAELPQLGVLALQTYLDARPDPAVRAALCRIARLVCGAGRVLGPLGRHLPWRDVQAFFRLADTLRLLLHP